MGGNVVMSYAGVRPARIRRLVNLEGFGMPRTEPTRRPAPGAMAGRAEAAAVAAQLPQPGGGGRRLIARPTRGWRPRTRPPGWPALVAERRGDGRGTSAATRRTSASTRCYRVDDVLETWKLISAPLLWVEGDGRPTSRAGGARATRRASSSSAWRWCREVERLPARPAGHMLHHDQPEALARALEAFLDAN
jgi:pimeloyl-ACP methyl ester carboxylesterase